MYPEMIMINKMWDEFPELKEDLVRCRNYILDFIDIPNEEVRDCVLELVNKDAKLIRPALMITIGKILNEGKDLDEDFIAMASTLEMLHMATLVHDDVVDDSPLRRGVSTVQNRFGKDVATYAGDYMLSSVFSNVLKYSKSMENAKKITDSVSKILSGELIQMQNRGNLDIEEQDYYDVIYGKTAVMIALCCYEGAYMVGKEEQCEEAWIFGESVGMAFQIIDDTLDFSSEDIIKKPPFQDFREGNFTLPVIYSKKYDYKGLLLLREKLLNYCFDKKTNQEKLNMAKKLNNNSYVDVRKKIDNLNIEILNLNMELKNIVENLGGINYSKIKANEFSDKAIFILNKYNDGIYKKYLEKLVLRLLNRKY